MHGVKGYSRIALESDECWSDVVISQLVNLPYT